MHGPSQTWSLLHDCHPSNIRPLLPPAAQHRPAPSTSGHNYLAYSKAWPISNVVPAVYRPYIHPVSAPCSHLQPNTVLRRPRGGQRGAGVGPQLARGRGTEDGAQAHHGRRLQDVVGGEHALVAEDDVPCALVVAQRSLWVCAGMGGAGEARQG